MGQKAFKKSKQYSAIDHSKRARVLGRAGKAEQRELQKALLEAVKGNGIQHECDSHPAGGNGKGANGSRVAFSRDVLNSLQGKLNAHGYNMAADEISLEVKKLWAAKPEIFVSKEVRGRMRFGFFHPNSDGKRGGFVEITTHLHESDRKNHVRSGSVVLGSCVLDGARISGQSTVYSGKITNSSVYASFIEGHTVLENCRSIRASKLTSCIFSNVKSYKCTFDRCVYSKRKFEDEAHVKNAKVGKQSLGVKKSWIRGMAELERRAWSVFSVLNEEPVKNGGTWRESQPAIYRNL